MSNTELIIENALSGWTSGQEIVARKEFDHGTTLAITRDEVGRFSLFRAFILGERAEVSADLQDVDEYTLMTHLLENGRY
jgi:hypothetical protein